MAKHRWKDRKSDPKTVPVVVTEWDRWPNRAPSHEGIWRDHRYGTNGILAREYFERNACPLCTGGSGLFFMRTVSLEHVGRVIQPKTHHGHYFGPQGLTEIDTCFKHYEFIQDLFWMQARDRTWRS